MASQVSPAAGSYETHEGLGFWARVQRDKPWWLLPVTTVVVLGGFSLYALWTAFLGPGDNHVSEAGPYLSPFFSPLLFRHGPITPALWVLWSPLLFRATCYYYRKAYYRSFFWDPPACAIGEMRHREYKGETRFPLFLNNLHRFFLYAAIIVIVFLWIDAIAALVFNGHLYFGLGTLIMLVNVVLLSLYTFGCHGFRHLVGGGLNCFSRAAGGKARHSLWQGVTVLNVRHAAWAWLSMFSVVITDIYIRLVQTGMSDPHLTW
jgi:hypothetical protein